MTSFEDLLSRGLHDVNPQVVARARRRFSSQIFLAIAENNGDSAIQVYGQTLALPQTGTELMLSFEGYELNGAWLSGNDNLIVCYKDTVPHLLKALNPKEFTRASSLFVVLKEQTLPCILGAANSQQEVFHDHALLSLNSGECSKAVSGQRNSSL